MKKSLIIGLVISAAVVAVGVWAWLKPQAEVVVVEPQRKTMRAYVEEQAVTHLPQDWLVAMPISGWLEPVTLREGDKVKQGDVVARLDTADLADRVTQARHRVSVLQTKIEKTQDNRLENHALTDAEATVKALDEAVKASEAKLLAYKAITEFSQSEVQRVKGMMAQGAASDREQRAVETDLRKAQAEERGNALDLAALKTIAAVSYIGPQFIRDYIDRKSFELATLHAQLAEAQAELAIEERNLARAELQSPIDGVVLERMQTRRQYLAAGTPIMSLGDLADLEVIAEVLTQRATRLKPGDRVEIFGEALPDGPVAGAVTRIYPLGFKKVSSLGVEQQRVNVAIAMDQRPAGLGAEFRVQVRIQYAEAPDALVLPRTAIFRSSEGAWQAMVVRDGVLALVTLEVGLLNDDEVQIMKGVGAGDEVVARPSNELTPGMRVQPVE
ncbi:MAG TPA: efflux RND transporter periplasmic adaptor subunit [Phycisphaerae bacterium]|nr:efflux RND transporter periplasmic adaptor subunit [Phycisphaerales bacterium]HRX84208.1 efflux RND transporter periplasmic adaptor subunit [Phycisphaerae bacterium]